MAHLHDELASNSARVVVDTLYGKVIGGRANNGAAVFLEIPYALPPVRFSDAEPLPDGWQYPLDKEYLTESSYCFQPHNDGQASGTPFADKVGYGKPTENPLFLNIICPPSFEPSGAQIFPVKIYIHGGFLQFGSPHGLRGQDQFVSAEFSEVRVNIGYRLSAFGFLASDKPRLDGNYGFKDQWLALEWVKKNISAFGGNPEDITLLGLSAGAHSVHQILHHVSRLPETAESPFQSAILMSNAIVMVPKTPSELRPQLEALCHALHLDPQSPDILKTLQDPSIIPASKICEVIETDALGTEYGTFRGCVDDNSWMASSPDLMTWQRSGSFASSLAQRGLKSIVIGDLTEEWYLYSIAHPIATAEDIAINLERYYPIDMVKRMISMYRQLGEDAEPEECVRLFGEILSDWQVHLPVRVLARDLHRAGFPVLRYEIAWTPEQQRPEGFVTHGGDSFLWHFRIPDLEADQVQVAKNWLERVNEEVKNLERNKVSSRSVKEVLKLGKDKEIAWAVDDLWYEKMRLVKILQGESE
ncbi:carboxylesterase [Lentinula guzmanii]|uniref:Carboxylic ester hydrolase n=1 Tax=Lentinula guzmanii TaxID=2804957 RepID=A0AA38J3S8_9AGAR|nr:carboxylesterase [Lentinula guzmanii]